MADKISLEQQLKELRIKWAKNLGIQNAHDKATITGYDINELAVRTNEIFAKLEKK